ncbi:MAG: hypothetical protein OXK82_05575 [Deltaproteobacteria bacterium]|nr:hypothetical protein [Deltaproteobacteria bacterium]
MPLPEQQNRDRQTKQSAQESGLTQTGLSPIVEKMFGALVENFDETKEVTSPESEASKPKRPGAA